MIPAEHTHYTKWWYHTETNKSHYILKNIICYQSSYNDNNSLANLISICEHDYKGVLLKDRLTGLQINEDSALTQYVIEEHLQVPGEYEGDYYDTFIRFQPELCAFQQELKGTSNTIDSVIFNGSVFSLSQPYNKDEIRVSFSVSWHSVKEKHAYPWMVWFLEDYYKYTNRK